MGRPRIEVEPLVVVEPGEAADRDLWQILKTLGGKRLGLEQHEGFLVAWANAWHELDAQQLPAAERITALSRFAVERGARQRDVDGHIERARRTVADGSWAERQRRRDEMRKALTVGV
jgi:hypothetical protein